MVQYIIYSVKYFSRKHACYCHVITLNDAYVTTEQVNLVFNQPH